MKIHIKNMISSRCTSQVEQTLLNMGIEFTDLRLGEVNINKELSLIQELELKSKLKESGFLTVRISLFPDGADACNFVG
jgi:hypothetical protein